MWRINLVPESKAPADQLRRVREEVFENQRLRPGGGLTNAHTRRYAVRRSGIRQRAGLRGHSMEVAELATADIVERFREQPAKPKFERIYRDDSDFSHVYAVLHGELNRHFIAINDRAKTTQHYWAQNSRDFLELIEEVNRVRHTLRLAGVEVEVAPEYEEAIERCEPWLTPSGGSPVPDGFKAIDLLEYEPAFREDSKSTVLKKSSERPNQTMIGSGSYANVYSYIDPDYDIKFAVKRAKKSLREADVARFRREFETLSALSFPYIVEVYRYDSSRNEYRMEYCDETLRAFIDKRNGSLTVATRKRIALQFLYGLNYVHSKHLLHRDISLHNILMKVYDSGAVLVKLSDFGLVKTTDSELTRTGTEMKGTIRDPLLEHFGDYSLVNEIYAIGHVLAFIFTGRKAISVDDLSVRKIIERCTANDYELRYQNVAAVIDDVENLSVHTTGHPA